MPNKAEPTGFGHLDRFPDADRFMDALKKVMLMRSDAYKAVFRPSIQRDKVLADLAAFCRVHETVPTEELARVAGRQDVFRHIQKQISLSDDALWGMLQADLDEQGG